MPHSDASADAFMARILANPADPLPKLVFADWLEESGTSSNIAWARYLRLADELANTPPDDIRRHKLKESLSRFAGSIRARLTFRAETLVANPEAMLRLLPSKNLVVNVETVVIQRSVLELLPESVARESQVIPFAELPGRTYLLGAVDPLSPQLAERIGFILNCDPLFVGVAEVGMIACLGRNYGELETESVDSVSYRWLPEDGWLTGGSRVNSPMLEFGDLLVLEAFEYAATALEFESEATRFTAWHWYGALRREREYRPSTEAISQLVPLLQSYLRNPATGVDGTTTGELIFSYWGRPRTLAVRITDRPNGVHVVIALPPEPPTPPIAVLNPAA